MTVREIPADRVNQSLGRVEAASVREGASPERKGQF